MKVIFLDFDGVINNWDHFDGIDYNNLKVLLEIIKLSNAKIVITSSLKYNFQLKRNSTNHGLLFDYIKSLKEHGIDIYGFTPYINQDREKEIISFLNEHPEIEEFLILDDDYIITTLKEHQIFLELYKGLTVEHIKPALDILNGKLGFYPPNFDFNEATEQRLIRINKYYGNKKEI